jgi:hypothetical protein
MLNDTLTAARCRCAVGRLRRQRQRQEDRAAHHRIDDGQDRHDRLKDLLKARQCSPISKGQATQQFPDSSAGF